MRVWRVTYICILIVVYLFIHYYRAETKCEMKKLTSFTLSLRCLAMGSLSSPPTITGSLSEGAGGTVSKVVSGLCTINDEELLVRTRDSPMSGFSNVFCCWYSSSIFAYEIRHNRRNAFFARRFKWHTRLSIRKNKIIIYREIGTRGLKLHIKLCISLL